MEEIRRDTIQKPKGGAPRKKVKREMDIRIRLTATEKFLIENKAKAAGMRASNWVRAAAKTAKVIPRLTVEELSILRMLAGLANNLNQLTKLAHQQGILSVALRCRDLLVEIDTTLKHLNNDDRESNHR
ncbi:plasmid mobilization protein [Solitalea lacus]|uniref:plasmid mobilization protein n=1 Tax=Solitalea lacus TaxID=2911172 RepID=UPI001EDB8EB8|nr:plasmid mobilization relaxosome protein MobC [Solitalea lacus]UKJ07368.1 MobC family plasmid mobilization relaxosome protein [Solitalea lacus]